uniref:Uncharacterized protein n=2 Tax=Anguilla anguilla TaxID=7936 RepID=A0A0E9Q830_ANGAN
MKLILLTLSEERFQWLTVFIYNNNLLVKKKKKKENVARISLYNIKTVSIVYSNLNIRLNPSTFATFSVFKNDLRRK